MFLSLEVLFRDVTGYSDFAVSNTESEFMKRCDTDVASHFYAAIDVDSTPRRVLEETFDKILKLYFKIRIHHKCSQIMNKIKTHGVGCLKPGIMNQDDSKTSLKKDLQPT